MIALLRVTITVRPDGLLDVLREREDTGERILGCRSWEEAFDAARAHPGVADRDVLRTNDATPEADPIEELIIAAKVVLDHDPGDPTDDGCRDALATCVEAAERYRRGESPPQDPPFTAEEWADARCRYRSEAGVYPPIRDELVRAFQSGRAYATAHDLVDVRCHECGEMMTSHVTVTRHASGPCDESFTGPGLCVANATTTEAQEKGQ